jgi:uncharacterized membrane protein
MSKISLPEALHCGKGYSFKTDMKVNAWAFVALFLALQALWLKQHNAAWPDAVRSVVALCPLLPCLFYVRSLSRWNHSLDELQCRIQMEAALFAITGALFLATALSELGSIGILKSTSWAHGLGFLRTFAVILFLYVLRATVLSRRYR